MMILFRSIILLVLRRSIILAVAYISCCNARVLCQIYYINSVIKITIVKGSQRLIIPNTKLYVLVTYSFRPFLRASTMLLRHKLTPNKAAIVITQSTSCVRLACQSTSQQYCSLRIYQHQPPATSQSAVLFSHNKSAPSISHSHWRSYIVAKGGHMASPGYANFHQVNSILALFIILAA